MFLHCFLNILLLLFYSSFVQIKGVVKIDTNPEQKFSEGTLADGPSLAQPESQTPMDVDKASIYR